MIDDRIWEVMEEFISDNTQMRRIRASTGEEEVVTLATLKLDAKSPKFRMIEGKSGLPKDEEKED